MKTLNWQSEEVGDFRRFLYVVWKHLNLPDPTPIQYDIADYLQSGPKRKIIQAFRGVGKSWITSAYTLWRLYWNPQVNILVVSASKERADAFSTFTLRLIKEMPLLAPLIPNSDRGQRDSKISFDVGPAQASHAPSVKSVGIYGQLTGSRADVIIADDVEVPNNSFTQTMRDKLAEAVKEFDAILSTKQDTEITYLGTPQIEMSLYNTLRNRGYSTRIWPARVPSSAQKEKYGASLAPLIDRMTQTGDSVDPKRFTDGDLKDREASYGRSGFSLQFLLDTSLSDAERYPLKLRDLSVMYLDPERGPEKVIWGAGPELVIKDLMNVGQPGDGFHRPIQAAEGSYKPYQGCVMALDPSGTGRDEYAWSIVKHLNGYLYCVDCDGHRLGLSEEGEKLLLDRAERYQVNKILVSPGYGDSAMAELLRRYITQNDKHITVEEYKGANRGYKEQRILETLEPTMNQHKLIFDRTVVENDMAFLNGQLHGTYDGSDTLLYYSLFYQMTHITKDRGSLSHDDRLDALGYACAYWKSRLSIDEDRVISQANQREFIDTVNIMNSNYLHPNCFDMLVITGDPEKALKAGHGVAQERWVNV